MAQFKKDDPLKSGPAAEQEDSLTLKFVKKGMTWGAVAGLLAGKMYISWQSIDTPVGDVFEGNVLLVFAVSVGGLAAIGAGIGWLMANPGGGENAPPPNNLLR